MMKKAIVQLIVFFCILVSVHAYSKPVYSAGTSNCKDIEIFTKGDGSAFYSSPDNIVEETVYEVLDKVPFLDDFSQPNTRTVTDGFDIEIGQTTGKLDPGKQNVLITVTASTSLSPYIADIESFGIRFAEPGQGGSNANIDTPIGDIADDSCPAELQNSGYIPLYKSSQFDSNNKVYENTLPLNLPPGIDCDIHLITNRNNDICDFNGIGERGDLRTSGNRDESKETYKIFDLRDLPGGGPILPVNLCNRFEDYDRDCHDCVIKGGVITALGCIPIRNMTSFAVGMLGFAAGVGFGIAFLLVVFGGFKYLMSAGNPEKIAEAKEVVTNAIAGLLLILFSAVILRIIGVDILQIPGFGAG